MNDEPLHEFVCLRKFVPLQNRKLGTSTKVHENKIMCLLYKKKGY